jgi:RNA-directed DNA polymerase
MIVQNELFTCSGNRLRVFQGKLTEAAKAGKSRKFGILYDKVCWEETLQEAWKLVRANKGSAGVDGKTIRHIEESCGVSQFLEELRTELVSKSYRPEKVRRVWIDKPGKKEKRPLGIPTVKDRVIQQAVRLIIEPILEVDFRDCSYGFRPGRSAHQAVGEVSRQLTFRNCWVIDLDIKSYFDSIPHEKLITLLQGRIKDKWIIRLVRRWLKAGVMDGKEFRRTEAGTPQGGVISPLLANLYLNEIDRSWEEKGYADRYKQDCHLIRYADDMVVLCPTRARATFFFRKLEAMLAELGLTLNRDKSKIAHLKEGFDFLGFHFTSGYSYRRGKDVAVKFPSAKAVKGIKANVKEVLKGNCLGRDLNEVVKSVNARLRGWGNYFRVGNSYRQFLEVNAYAVDQLRLFLRRRYQRKRDRGFRTFPGQFLYGNLGLCYLPGTFSRRMPSGNAGEGKPSRGKPYARFGR